MCGQSIMLSIRSKHLAQRTQHDRWSEPLGNVLVKVSVNIESLSFGIKSGVFDL